MLVLMHWAVVAEWLHQVVHVDTKTCMFKAMAHKQQLWALFYSTEDTHVEGAMRLDVLPQNGVGCYSLQLWSLPPTCVLQTGQRTATMEAGAILPDVILTWPSLHSERLLTQSAGIVPTQYRRYLLCFWKTHELSKQFPFQILLNIQSHTFWASGHMQSSCKTWNNELCQMVFHNHPMRDQFYHSHSCEALRFCLQFLCFFWLVTAGFHAWSMDPFVSSFRATGAGTLCSSPM